MKQLIKILLLYVLPMIVLFIAPLLVVDLQTLHSEAQKGNFSFFILGVCVDTLYYQMLSRCRK